MPFKSKAQMAYLFAKHPEIAKKWAKETKDEKNLPEHKSPWLKMGKEKG